mgnify:CR=1 FL=1
MRTGWGQFRKVPGGLEEVAGKYGGKVAILSIVTMPDTMPKVTQYSHRNNVTTPLLLACGQVMVS